MYIINIIYIYLNYYLLIQPILSHGLINKYQLRHPEKGTSPQKARAGPGPVKSLEHFDQILGCTLVSMLLYMCIYIYMYDHNNIYIYIHTYTYVHLCLHYVYFSCPYARIVPLNRP